MEPTTHEEAMEILRHSRLGILSLADGGKAYGVPLFYGFDGETIWFHCHPGQKDHFEDTTEEACFTVMHLESENIWESVHAFGPVERCTLSTDIEAAKSALYQVPFPPRSGTYPGGLPVRDDLGIYYLKLKAERVEGVKSKFQEKAAPNPGA